MKIYCNEYYESERLLYDGLFYEMKKIKHFTKCNTVCFETKYPLTNFVSITQILNKFDDDKKGWGINHSFNISIPIRAEFKTIALICTRVCTRLG